MDSLKNKKVLIVGATGGIGAHLVKLIYNSGAQVWIAGRQFAKLNLIAESNQLPASQILEVDLSNSDSVQNFVKKSKMNHLTFTSMLRALELLNH